MLDKQLIKLSNGETKRLVLAAALIKNPLLLLLDNPLNGLDVDSRQDFNDLIREISGSGISIIMATSPGEVPDAITHVAVLEKGKMISGKEAAKASGRSKRRSDMYHPNFFNIFPWRAAVFR